MWVEQFIQQLQTQGIQLWAEDGRLRFRAPQGLMTADLRAQLQDHKTEIIAWLEGQNTPAITPLPAQADYALSPAQWRLWVLMQMENSSVAYNVPLHQLIEGPLDVDRLRYALQQLAARHESLRTCFVVVDGQPRQKIVPEATIELELVEEATETAVWQMSLEEAKRPFTLTTAPLCRAKLVRLSSQRHALLLTLHHLICDGISIGILNREITQCYGGASLPPLKLQYRDYAHWQNQWLLSEEAIRYRHYWQQQLAGELPTLNLPTDFPRPAVQTFNGREQTFHVSAELLTQIKQVARREGATLFMFLLAALKTLLYRYTGQTDLIVGTPAAARPHADLYDQVGFYLNTLPLRTTIDPNQPFTQLLGQVKTTVTGGLEHQIYPFDQLVNELAVRRDLSRGPLFDVMLILQNQPDAGMQLGDLQVRPFFQHSQTSKVDITFNLNEDAAGLHLGIEYNSDLFTPERINRLGGHWQTLVAGIVADPERPLCHLPLLPDEESRQLLAFAQTSKVSETFEAFTDTIPDLWHKVVQHYGAETAVIAGEKTLTFAQVDALSTQLAHALRQYGGIETEDRVALLLNRTEWLPVALLAVLKAGAAYVPIDPIYPPERIATILAHSQSKLLLTEETWVEQWRDGETAVSTPSALLSSLLSPLSSLPPHPPHTLAYITYTSGSTGQPKGVMVTQSNLAAFTANMTATWGFTAADRILALTPITFDIAGLELLCSLLTGLCVVVAADADMHQPEKLFALLQRHQITALQLTPSRLKLLLAGREVLALAQLRVLLIGGEPLPEALFGELRPLFPHTQLYNVYGPTETTIWSTSKPLNDGVLNIGKPLFHETALILDPHHNLCPIGVVGEICIGGDGVARGYWQQAELTAEKFVEYSVLSTQYSVNQQLSTEYCSLGTLYRTGDLGYWRPDGTIVCLGRQDDQVKIRGFRVELGEVEAGLVRCAGVQTAVIAVHTDHFGDNQLIAYWITKAAPSPTAEQLRAELRRFLPEYMIPAVFVPITAVPLTQNGKVDRKTLLALQTPAAQSTPYAPPQNDQEKQMAAIWQAVLELPQVGRDDNFFDLGGHSLKAMRIAAQVQQEMGMKMTLLDIFQHQTVAALTAVLTPEPEIAPMTDEEMALLWAEG